MMMKNTPCPPEAGKYVPKIDLNKCEAKGDCLAVCPYEVFALQKISQDTYQSLSMFGKIKTLVHGRNKAVAANASACHACGLCVKACPEKAIELVKVVTG